MPAPAEPLRRLPVPVRLIAPRDDRLVPDPPGVRQQPARPAPARARGDHHRPAVLHPGHRRHPRLVGIDSRPDRRPGRPAAARTGRRHPPAGHHDARGHRPAARMRALHRREERHRHGDPPRPRPRLPLRPAPAVAARHPPPQPGGPARDHRQPAPPRQAHRERPRPGHRPRPPASPGHHRPVAGIRMASRAHRTLARPAPPPGRHAPRTRGRARRRDHPPRDARGRPPADPQPARSGHPATGNSRTARLPLPQPPAPARPAPEPPVPVTPRHRRHHGHRHSRQAPRRGLRHLPGEAIPRHRHRRPRTLLRRVLRADRRRRGPGRHRLPVHRRGPARRHHAQRPDRGIPRAGDPPLPGRQAQRPAQPDPA